MKHEDLPDRWKRKIIAHLRANGKEDRTRLNAYDFPLGQSLRLTFEDDSFAAFQYAFVITAPELKEIGVFTEHCGYHIFNLEGITINILNNET